MWRTGFWHLAGDVEELRHHGRLVDRHNCGRYLLVHEPLDWDDLERAGPHQELPIEAGAAASDVAVVALSGQMMGCTPVDREGNPLRPSVLYCDQRAAREAAQLLSGIDPKSFYDIAGHRPGRQPLPVDR